MALTIMYDDFLDLPKITSTSSNRELVRGTEVILTCTANSNGSVAFTWTFQGKTLVSSSKMSINRGPEATTLMVRSLSYPDHGIYTCRASNLAGSVFQNHSISVTGEVTTVV